MSGAYYNEIDPFAAAWLRSLISAGHIAPGDVDERDVQDVRPDEIRGYTQHHFFAGIGVWSYALRQAGWPDDRSVATGSCPCQPFSTAGRGGGFADERHLWPAFFHLIEQCNFPVVLGEQVASKDGLAWLDLVQADMEGADYTGGAVDICSAGFGAPHRRQRINFVWLADAGSSERNGLTDSRPGNKRNGPALRRQQGNSGVEPRCTTRGLADANDARSQGWAGMPERTDKRAIGPGRLAGREQPLRPERGASGSGAALRPRPTNGFWRDADWLLCRNPTGEPGWRPVEPGTFPLAHGAANRMGRLRGYGNAVNAAVTQGFIEAVMGTIPDMDDFDVL